MRDPGPLREVVEDHRFRRDAELLGLEPRRLDEALEGLKWELARDPERGVPVPETPLRALPIYPRGGEFLVYYTFDDRQVRLVSIVPGDLL